MNKEFKEKLQLYKNGKLNGDEVIELEAEIDKFLAIKDYLDEDEQAFWEEVKEQTPASEVEKNKRAAQLKRKVNLRIIMMTAVSIVIAFLIIILLYSLANKVTQSLFGLDHKQSFVEREEVVQLVEMLHPQYVSHRSGTEQRDFAQQTIRIYLENTVGNTEIDQIEMSVQYSLRNPVRSEISELPPLLSRENSYLFESREPNLSGFDMLEKAPKGTKAEIFVEFDEAITPEMIKENFLKPLSNAEITPLAALESALLIANASYYEFTPVFPYDKEHAGFFDDYGMKQEKYLDMNNQAHTESFLGNLELMKNNEKLLEVMYGGAFPKDINFDDIMTRVEADGVKYIGMYIKADTKELLTLRDHPQIHWVVVGNLVLW